MKINASCIYITPILTPCCVCTLILHSYYKATISRFIFIK